MRTIQCYIIVALTVFLACKARAQKPALKIGENVGVLSPSAALEIESTNKGFLLPRMSRAQMYNITSPSDGLMVYDTDNNCLRVCEGGKWTGCYQYAGSFDLLPLAATWSKDIGTSTSVSGVTVSVPYVNGDLAAVTSMSVNSTGVTGLVMTSRVSLVPQQSSGVLMFDVSGTTGATAGTANFTLVIGGTSYVLSTPVSKLPSASDLASWAPRLSGATADFYSVGGTGASPAWTDTMWGKFYLWGDSRGITFIPTTTAGTITIPADQLTPAWGTDMMTSAITAAKSWNDGYTTPCDAGYELPSSAQFDAIMGNLEVDASQSSGGGNGFVWLRQKDAQTHRIVMKYGLVSGPEKMTSKFVGGSYTAAVTTSTTDTYKPNVWLNSRPVETPAVSGTKYRGLLEPTGDVSYGRLFYNVYESYGNATYSYGPVPAGGGFPGPRWFQAPSAGSTWTNLVFDIWGVLNMAWCVKKGL